MKIKLSFLGGAGNVTGSRYLVETQNTRFLVDCGMHQEREFKARDWDPFPVKPSSIDAVLLTHAHLDHCGLLPKLVREGFKGKIYCTKATAEIAKIILLDSGKLQEEDAAYKRKRHEREQRKSKYPEVPLYTAAEALACSKLFAPIDYRKAIRVGAGVQATFLEAGHVLGSSFIKVKITQGKIQRTMLFSGDIGVPGKPILHDPAIVTEADYVVMESTYGDRAIEDNNNIIGGLADIINATVKARGNIVIPSFALERSQELLYYFNQLLVENRIPHLLVFLDSPMANSITDVFECHPELFDTEMKGFITDNHSPFTFKGLKRVKSAEESKAINHIAGTVIIIAGSGMANGGRIKHHLVANITRPESTILFVGYQARSTLGRQIVDGAKEVRILGQTYPVRAKIVQFSGLSGHADQKLLVKWLSELKIPPRHIFITHGEPESAQTLAGLIKEKTGWNTSVPAYLDEVELD